MNSSSSTDNNNNNNNDDEILHVHYDYTSKGDDELTLKRGSKLEVLSKDKRISGSEGWWTGRLVDSKSVGIFPANFVATSQPNLRVIDYQDLQIGDLIGVGGFGHVHYGKFGDVDVAIKTAKSLSSFSTIQTPTLSRKIHDHDRSDAVQKSLIDDLIREARLFSNLKHQNIIQLFGVSPSVPTRNLYLVMEYAHGGALSQLLQKRQCGLYPHTLIRYVKQIADGMKYLHDEACESIIHRDLKSSNVLILEPIDDVHNDADLRVKTLKITDFGLAKKQLQSSSTSTAGTYPWMSPECISNGDFSIKSDVWSFGVVLWECLTGEIPYNGFNQMQVAFGIAMKKYSLPIPSTCPEEFAQLMKNCWQNLPQDRPTFSQLCEQMTAIIERDYVDDDLHNSEPHDDTYQSLQHDWRDEIQTMFEELKNIEQGIRDREQQMIQQTIEQNHKRMQLEKREQQLHEYELQLLERELKLAMLTNNHERAYQHTPKVQKRSGHFMRALLHATLNGHSTLSSATAASFISSPTNFRHLISVSRDQHFHHQPSPSDSHQTPSGSQLTSTSTPTTPSQGQFPTLTFHCPPTTAHGFDFDTHFDKSARSPSLSHNKTSSGTMEHSRWRRQKSGAPTPCIKHKNGTIKIRHGEPKWYLETITNINHQDTTSISSTKSSATQKLGSLSSSVCSIPDDRSLARGIFYINTMLMAISLGRSIPKPHNASPSFSSATTTSQKFSSRPPTFRSSNEKLNRPKLSTSSSSTSSPPSKKQHKRTCSSPIANILAENNELTNIGYRARPSYSPVRPNSLVFASIPPPPPSSSRPTHISQSDSQLNTRHKQPSTKMTRTPEEDEHPSDIAQHDRDTFYSVQSSNSSTPMATSSNLSKSEQHLHVSSLLDIETEEQKKHQTKVLPPEIDRKKFFISLQALERDFLP